MRLTHFLILKGGTISLKNTQNVKNKIGKHTAYKQNALTCELYQIDEQILT